MVRAKRERSLFVLKYTALMASLSVPGQRESLCRGTERNQKSQVMALNRTEFSYCFCHLLAFWPRARRLNLYGMSFIISKVGEITAANCGVREMILPNYSPHALTAIYSLILQIHNKSLRCSKDKSGYRDLLVLLWLWSTHTPEKYAH